MGKKWQKKTDAKRLPPNGYERFFSAASDEAFKEKHPIGYAVLVIFAIVALLCPAILFCVWVGKDNDSGWIMLGFVGGFIFGIGLFNFVAIIIKQYLGHLVSIVSFLIGGLLMFLSWLLCR